MAYDVRRHRVWAICNHCERWTLLLPEDRPAALHHLQRIARDEAHVVGSTANVTLLEAAWQREEEIAAIVDDVLTPVARRALG